MKEKIIVDFSSVADYSRSLKKQSEDFKSNLNNNGNLVTSFSSLSGVGLVPSYFSEYSSYLDKTTNFMSNLSDAIIKYHDDLATIEGYVAEETVEKETSETVKRNRRGYTPSTITTTGDINTEIEQGTEGAPVIETRIPGNIVIESGYGKQSIYVTTPELISVIEKIISGYGITLAQLLSGDYNLAMTDIITQAPNLSVLISTITQMNALVLQGYLRELSTATVVPPLYPNVELFLNYLAEHENTTFNVLLTEQNYADTIRDSLIKHKESLVMLNDLALTDSTSIQKELSNIIFEEAKPINNIDPVTKKMLKDYLELVAKENNISLSDMLTKEEFKDLSKKSIENFVNTIMYGEKTGIPLVELEKEISGILDDKNTNLEDILNGKDNDALTEIINETDDKTGSEIIKNMDDEALQEYVKEVVVDEKHPTIIEKPVIKEIIKTIVINKDKIIGKTTPIKEPTLDPIIDDIKENSKEEFKEEIVEEKPIIIDDQVKEILTNNKYAPQVKETVKNNGSLAWLALLPVAGLGLIPLYGMLKSRKDTEEETPYYQAEPITNKILVSEPFANFAISNGATEESLLDGRNFEVLTMYLSGISSLSTVLNILSLMKDEHLQKYLYELYTLKLEHIWSKNSLILKIIFNALTETANKQASSLDTILSNSNYVVWIKSSILDLSQAYSKFEEDIKFNGGFVSFINNVLNRTIAIKDESYELLKVYVETNAKNEELSQNTYLEQILNDDNKLKIFSIIKYADGYDKYTFGFLNSLNILNESDELPILNTLNLYDRIIRDSGYLDLLFNSSDEQIYNAINKILEKNSVKKEDLFNGTKEDLLDTLINRAPNIIVILTLLSNFEPLKLQQYLNKLDTQDKGKFILFIFKFLNYLAKAENTTLETLLTNPNYAVLIKENLYSLRDSILKLYELTKKEDDLLNTEINKIFFIEDPTIFGVDKITIKLLKDYLASSADKVGMGLNALLDLNNIETLRKFMNSLVGNIIYSSFDDQDTNTNKQIVLERIETVKPELKPDKKNIVSKLKMSFERDSDSILKKKLKKYIEMLGKDTNVSFEEYLVSNELSNFININFDNLNLMELVNKYISSGVNYSFELEEKQNEILKSNNLNIEELTSVNGTNFIIDSIIKSNNIIYNLEVLVNSTEEAYNKMIIELNMIKENTDLKDVFNYVEEHLKRPKSLDMTQYLSDKINTKNIWMLLLKLLIMILIILYLSAKEEEVL